MQCIQTNINYSFEGRPGLLDHHQAILPIPMSNMLTLHPRMSGRGGKQLTLCLFWKAPATHLLPSVYLYLSLSLSPSFVLQWQLSQTPSQIHVHPCVHIPWLSSWSAEADSERLLSQLMCLQSFATFNGLLQQCNCKCCMLTRALMVALACLLGVLVGHFWLGGRGWLCETNGGGGSVTF